MKKKIASLALIAMSLVAIPGFAQNKTERKADNTCTEANCTRTADSQRAPKACPFDGLNLSEAQKTKLQELGKQRQEARKAKAETLKQQAEANKKELKANRMRRDSTAVEARKADKKAYLEEIKAIVGPENYVIFLENSYINAGTQGRGQNMGPRQGGDRKDVKANKNSQQNGKNGQKRPNRNAKVAQAATTANS